MFDTKRRTMLFHILFRRLVQIQQQWSWTIDEYFRHRFHTDWRSNKKQIDKQLFVKSLKFLQKVEAHWRFQEQLKVVLQMTQLRRRRFHKLHTISTQIRSYHFQWRLELYKTHKLESQTMQMRFQTQILKSRTWYDWSTHLKKTSRIYNIINQKNACE